MSEPNVTIDQTVSSFSDALQSYFLGPTKSALEEGQIAAMGELLQDECAHIGYAIVMPLLVLQIMIIGLMTMQRYSFSDQLGVLLIRVMIVTLILSAVPQNMLRTAMPKLRDGGMEVGTEIVRLRNITRIDDESSRDPIKYWGKWMGDPKQANTLFHIQTIMDMFYENSASGNAPDAVDPTSGQSFGFFASLANIFEKLLQILINVVVAILAPFMIMGFLIAITMMQIGAFFAPAMAQVTILIGSRYVLEILLCLGIAAVPLVMIDFQFAGVAGATSSKSLGAWMDWLIMCIGLTFVPCLYYIFSAIGFHFATGVFDTMFPEAAARVGDPQTNTNPGFGLIMKTALSEGIIDNAKTMLGELGGVTAGIAVWLLEKYIHIFRYLFYGAAGTMVISSTVASGVGFATLATAAAMNWYKMFVFEGMQEQISSTINQMQGSIGTGMGQAYGQGFSSASNMVGGAMKGMGRMGGR